MSKKKQTPEQTPEEWEEWEEAGTPLGFLYYNTQLWNKSAVICF